MKISIEFNGNQYAANLHEPLDISIPITEGTDKVNCFYAPPVEFLPVRMGDFVGSTQEGGIVNFKNVRINPHGNGTHTECVGHIAKEVYTINQSLQNFHHIAQLETIYPQQLENGDRVILKSQLEALDIIEGISAFVIRTMPNREDKRTRSYSGNNPPYIHHEALAYLVELGIEHLLLDLPSVDREEDEGKLLGHRAFWQYPDNTRTQATITELIFVKDTIKDGLYLLNIQIASFEIDASPSKPVLYRLRT